MAKFKYAIPSEFTDEDKWFKFFTKKTLTVLVVTGAFTVFLYKMFGAIFNKAFIGILIGALVMIISALITMMPVSDDKYLKGGGQTLDSVFLKILIRKKNRRIYVLGYEDEDEVGENE